MLPFILNGLTEVLQIVFFLVQILVLASVIVSWVSADPNNPIVQIIYNVTEPIYRPIRRYTSKIPGPLDWAPLIVLLLVIFLSNSLIPYLRALSQALR